MVNPNEPTAVEDRSAPVEVVPVSAATEDLGAVPDPKRWLALSVLFAALFMDMLDGGIVNVAIPQIQQALGVSAAQIQWITAGYMLSFGVLLIPGGRLGDIFGRKRMFLVGVAGFMFGSAACAAAFDAEVLVVARVLQGAFAAMMVPQVLAIIRVTFSREFGKVVGASALIGGVAVVAGPLVGGLLVEADVFGLQWRTIFAVNVPVGALALVLASRWVVESRATAATRLDVGGVGLAVLGLLLLLVPLVEGRELGWPTWSIASLVLTVPVFVLFVRHQRRRIRTGRSPLVVLGLFRERGFWAGILVQLLFQGLPAAFFLVWTLYLQSGLGWSPLRTGLASIPFSIAVAVSGGLSVQVIYPRLGRTTLMLGAVLMFAGLVHFGVVASEHGQDIGVGHMVVPLVLIGLGMGQVISPLTGLILGFVPQDDAGSASGLITATAQVGAALGVAFIGVVFFGAAGDGLVHAFSLATWFLGGQLAVVFGLLFALPRLAGTEQ